MSFLVTSALFALLASNAMIAQPEAQRTSVPLSEFRTGDMPFTCSGSDSTGRTLRTIGFYYTRLVQEVTFSHQGQTDVLSSGWLRAPVTQVQSYIEDGLRRWDIVGSGQHRGANYSLRARIEQTVDDSLQIDFEIAGGGISMSGENCYAMPPRPEFYVPFSQRDAQ